MNDASPAGAWLYAANVVQLDMAQQQGARVHQRTLREVGHRVPVAQASHKGRCHIEDCCALRDVHPPCFGSCWMWTESDRMCVLWYFQSEMRHSSGGTYRD